MFGAGASDEPHLIPGCVRFPDRPRDQVSIRRGITLNPAEDTAIFLVFGQSNAANWADDNYVSTQAKNQNFDNYSGCLFEHQGPVYNAQQPDSFTTLLDRRGTPMIRLGDKLIVASDFDRTIFYNVAFGGTLWSNWGNPLGSGFNFTRLNRRLTQFSCPGPTHVLVALGESDAAAGTSKASIKADALTAFGMIWGFWPGIPILLAKTTHWTGMVVEGGANQLAVRAAMDELVSENADVYAGPDTDTLNDTFRADGVHWNATGTDAAANLWVTAIASLP